MYCNSNFVGDSMNIQTINKALISADPHNPRSMLDDDEVTQLQMSIETDGQQEPVHLEELAAGKSYMITEGHKRVAAIMKSKKIATVSAIVETKLSPEDRLLKQIIIDTHRKNWSLIDRDKAWKRLWDMGKYDANSFAKKISVSKEVTERFIDRMDLGVAFVSKIENVSASNIDETKRIQDKEMRKKVLAYADKKGLGRIDVRKLATAATKVSSKVIDEVIKDNISIDDANNMVGLNAYDQQQHLETTRALNKHKKSLKKMITSGDIDVETRPLVEAASNKIADFQKRFFKLSSDLRLMGFDLDDLSKKDTKKLINTQMGNILRSCLTELEDKVLPAITKIKKTLGDI